MSKLVESLVIASEKSANIARICRQEKQLFSLLIEEKGEADANPRFVQDFKTLADVLIQETIRYDLSKKFPELIHNIFGEESNKFSNTLGESIIVEVKETLEETKDLLSVVLDGNDEAAELLAREVHKDVVIDNITQFEGIDIHFNIPLSEVGIWIDPIDSTAEYIEGKENLEPTSEISVSGLQCVTVLIGAFSTLTGNPIVGVVNQPFCNRSGGRYVWGISVDNIYINNIETHYEKTGVICISSSESQETKNILIHSGYKLLECAGAGYKLLMVILGYADAYILTKSSTYKWDTCGPHAILKSLHGGIKGFTDILKRNDIMYAAKSPSFEGSTISKFCNEGGIVAFRREAVLNHLVDTFKN